MAILDELEIVSSSRIDPARYPRPIISTLDTWDQHAQIDYHFNPAMPGRRAGWNIPSIAVTSETVNTVRNNVQLRYVSPRLATRSGMTTDPVTRSLVYKAVPNMAQNIRSDSSVQVQFSLTVAVQNPQAPFFAIFRDRVKISQEYRAAGETANVEFLVSGTYVDPNPPQGWHTYDLRWHVDGTLGGSMRAGGKNRTFQASNLRAQ